MLTKFNRAKTVDGITATMTKMTKQLLDLAAEREALCAAAREEAKRLEDKAEADYQEAVKARGVAEKIAGLVG